MKKFISIFLLLYITLPINAQDKTSYRDLLYTNKKMGLMVH